LSPLPAIFTTGAAARDPPAVPSHFTDVQRRRRGRRNMSACHNAARVSRPGHPTHPRVPSMHHPHSPIPLTTTLHCSTLLRSSFKAVLTGPRRNSVVCTVEDSERARVSRYELSCLCRNETAEEPPCSGGAGDATFWRYSINALSVFATTCCTASVFFINFTYTLCKGTSLCKRKLPNVCQIINYISCGE